MREIERDVIIDFVVGYEIDQDGNEILDKPIMYDGKDKGKKVKLKKLNAGERNDMVKESTITQVISGKEQISIDSVKVKELMIFKGIISGDVLKNITSIRDLDPEAFDYLFDQASELNKANPRRLT